jgi:hypothetical protein
MNSVSSVGDETCGRAETMAIMRCFVVSEGKIVSVLN